MNNETDEIAATFQSVLSGLDRLKEMVPPADGFCLLSLAQSVVEAVMEEATKTTSMEGEK